MSYLSKGPCTHVVYSWILPVCVHESCYRSRFIMYTLTYQNLLFCRVPINSILGFIIRTYKKVGYGSLNYVGINAWTLKL